MFSSWNITSSGNDKVKLARCRYLSYEGSACVREEHSSKTTVPGENRFGTPTKNRHHTLAYLVGSMFFDANVQIFLLFRATREEETRELSIIRAFLDRPSLASPLEFIGTNFQIVCQSINQLQGRIEFVSAVAIINRLRNQLNFEPYRTTLNQILSNSPDFDTISKYSKIIAGENIESNSDEKLNAPLYRNAPMVAPVISKKPFLFLQILKLIKRDNY